MWTPKTNGFVVPPMNGQIQLEKHSVAPVFNFPAVELSSWQQSTLAPTAMTAMAALALYTMMAKKKSRSTASTFSGRQIVSINQPQNIGTCISRKALDQSSRYADLELDEAELIKEGAHVLVAYVMKPKAGYDYLATAAHFAAESSTGTNVNVCTT
jgi:hypothetical protein